MSPDYDPTNRQVSVSGPDHAALVLGALGIGFGGSINVRDPAYVFNFDITEVPQVIAGLDEMVLSGDNEAETVAARQLGDALWDIAYKGALATKTTS